MYWRISNRYSITETYELVVLEVKDKIFECGPRGILVLVEHAIRRLQTT